MIASNFLTPHQMSMHLAKQARARRLFQNRSQKSLSEHSGVSYSVIKKFELTGSISLESLLKIAVSLGSLDDFYDCFKLDTPESFPSMDDLLKHKKRKRGRK